MIRTKSEDAVSPVIGVMLMLVVTIVIAAVVAVFAGGVGADVEPAPVTVVDIADISAGYDKEEEVQETLEMNTEFKDTDYLIYPYSDNTYYFIPNPDRKVTDSSKFEEWYMGNHGYNFDVIEDENEETLYIYGYPDGGFNPESENVFAIKDASGVLTFVGDDPLLKEKYMTASGGGTQTIKDKTKTLTLNCLNGESLDLSKISIQITGADYVIEIPADTFKGSLSVGETKELPLTGDTNLDRIEEGSEVDITVFYGDYVLAEEEKMTATWG